ncbi:transcriptional regulator [Saccharospirillum sp. MSK14-1]|uniref:LysR family transcriptional regulator n=1 Tax=Saccharospirillum sp. MSK14-1 TaxID=1897632 RepID=UPI000D372482|nr:LysR family transcriptional regulator [Saccharospirillum sp. MSK14-1]PTY37621.1 transcriptional regulator [Saccharospirillum sp. MSK14-1]
MDRLDAFALFCRIVELGSFTQAAEALNVPRATATQAIKDLETRLGARLLERTTRQVKPTPDGDHFYRHCLSILAELDDAEASLRQSTTDPGGVLRLDLHGSHATNIVLPNIDDFHRRYPRIDIRLSSGDRLVDLVAEGIDCVIRSGHPRDSSLVIKRLAVIPEVMCASPAYLHQHGTPKHPDDLRHHHAVGFFSRGYDSSYPFECRLNGEVKEYDLPNWISVNDAQTYIASALAGCGLIQLPRLDTQKHLDSGALVEVLADYPSPGIPVSVLYPSQRHLAPRVRVFVDWVSELYAAHFGQA